MVLCWSGMEIHSQQVLGWPDLSKGILWKPTADATMFGTAEFSDGLKVLEGTEVIVTGYFLYLEGNQPVYLLSKNPFASCFFCGNGGPETIIELQFSEEPDFIIDQLLSVSGILRLNPDDPSKCYYRIENAEALTL